LLVTWFLGIAVVLVDDYRIGDITHGYISKHNISGRPMSSLFMETKKDQIETKFQSCNCICTLKIHKIVPAKRPNSIFQKEAP
jgi:hypothetical protein